MITLRLFHRDDLRRQLDAYILGDGPVTIGRDSSALWMIEDPERQLSRLHCTVSGSGRQVLVLDTSANGVFLGQERLRAVSGVEAVVSTGGTFSIGPYVIVVDALKHTDGSEDELMGSRLNLTPMAEMTAGQGTRAVPDDWEDSSPVPVNESAENAGGDNFLLLEAFCAGARLDPSYLASEDPMELMRRLGEIYRQVVLGLGDLMSDRASFKSEYSLERTTIGATKNNLLKWAPTQRLAIDLICERNGGFLSGGAAVKECFEDLKDHSKCLLAGSRAAVSSVIEHLDPAAIEADSKANASLFMERSEMCWRRLKALHSEVATLPFNNPESRVNAAFKRGYEARVLELEPRVPDA